MSWMERLRGMFGGGGEDAADSGETAVRDIGCHEALEKLYEFLDGELESPSHEEVEHHFEVCKQCYPNLVREESFREALHRARDGESAPDELREKILRLLSESGDRSG